MATKPERKAIETYQDGSNKVLPDAVAENPSVLQQDQAYNRAVNEQKNKIMAFFLNVLPSNYTSQIKGPFYTLQFQAAAEQLAKLQVSAEEIFSDADYDYTRPEFLYQILGTLVFPDAFQDGLPSLESDLAQRRFLKDMVGILLKGSTKQALLEALHLLTDAEIQIIECSEAARTPGSAYTLEDQFTFEIILSQHVKTTVAGTPSHYHTIKIDETGYGQTVKTYWTGTVGTEHQHDIVGYLPEASAGHTHDLVSEFADSDPLSLLRNVVMVLKAIKPAHTLYQYKNLFRETFRELATDSSTTQIAQYDYDDLRTYWLGCKEISRTVGEILVDRTLLRDVGCDFSHVTPDAEVHITAGANKGAYRVKEILTFPVSSAPSVLCTTSPTGKTTHITVEGNVITAVKVDPVTAQWIPDTSFNWAGIIEEEVLTIPSGVCAGSYRFAALLGNDGGPLRVATGPAHQARMAPSLLRLSKRAKEVGAQQQYTVSVDRLGRQVPRTAIEDVSIAFVDVPFNTTFYTQRGPLVKNWGDQTPATLEDVVVTVNGIQVVLSEVNPYTGKVSVHVAPPVGAVVQVFYTWLPTPVFEMTGLNDPGLLLNQWDNASGHTYPEAHGEQPLDPAYPLGSALSGRFPMRTVLGPAVTPEPIFIGHRYLGLERDYSAVLNDPNSLLLNQNPNSIAVDYFIDEPTPANVFYDATIYPTLAGWVLQGSDSGVLQTNGTYTVKTQSPGVYASGQQALYYQIVDLSYPSSIRVNARFKVEAYTPFGVWSGVGFGTHDDKRTYQVGLLSLPAISTEPVFHTVGILLNPEAPQLETSWQVGPQVAITLLTQNSFTAPTNTLPSGITTGTRFKIQSGIQAGVYTVLSAISQSTGLTTVTTYTAFPQLISQFGAKYQRVLWETTFEQSTTYEMTVNLVTKRVSLFVAGALTGEMLSLTDPGAEPSQGALELRTEQRGQVWWGGLSRQATNQSTWSFFQYRVSPDSAHIAGHSKQVTVSGLPNTNPDPEQLWAVPKSFGHAEAGNFGTKIISGASSETLPYGYGYSRCEPFLGPQAIVDIDAVFKAERSSGYGDASILLYDSERQIELSNLEYAQPLGNLPRRLVQTPSVSVTGLQLPTQQGWAISGHIQGDVYERTLQTTPVSGLFGHYVGTLNPYIKALSGTASTWVPQTRLILEVHPGVLAGDTVTITVTSGVYVFTAVGGVPAAGQFQIVPNNVENTAHNLCWAIQAVVPDIQATKERNLVILYANTQGTDGYGFSAQCTSVKGLSPTTVVTFKEYSGYYGMSAQLKGTNTRFLEEINTGDYIQILFNGVLSEVVVAQLVNNETLLLSGAPGVLTNTPLHARTYVDNYSRTTEARLRINSYSGVDSGITIRGTANWHQYSIGFYEVAGIRHVGLAKYTAGVLTILNSWAFDWLGAYHTYRAVASATGNTVVLVADEVPLGSAVLNAFTPTSTNDEVSFGFHETADPSTNVDWLWVNHSGAPSTLKTLGLWRGGDRTDINNWEMPRTDALEVPNSDPNAVIFPMDWTSNLTVRVRRDPVWGVTVYRPDIAPPPYWAGAGGGGFNTEITDPTQGWLNLTTQEIPQATKTFGGISFGALASTALSVQTWGRFTYRIYSTPSGDYRSPEHMVLNYAHQVTSGELSGQTNIETLVVEALDAQHLSMIPTDINASQIYSVVDGNNLLSQTTWAFDPETQLLSLGYDTSGYPVYFSSEHAPITVTFTPGKPVTETYLTGLPFWQTQTKLNEGTPPFAPQRALQPIRDVISEFGTPYYHLEFNPVQGIVDNSSYDNCTVVTLQDSVENQTGLIAIAQDNLLPEGTSGWVFGEGEHIFDSNGADLGPMGAPAGTVVNWLKGAGYHEQAPVVLDAPWSQGAGWAVGPAMGNPTALYVSGGSFFEAYVDETDPLNPVAVFMPKGGLIGPTGTQPVVMQSGAIGIQDSLLEIFLT